MPFSVAIVDDSEELRHLLTMLLEDEFGVSCLSLGTLAEVQAHADEALKTEIVILDINLGPGQPDGVAVSEWLKENHYPGTILFFTGHAKDSPFVREAARTGIPILEKPMALEDLMPILEGLLRIPRRLTK